MIKEAFAGRPWGADLFVYGNTSDQDGEGTNTITIYYEPAYHPKFSLGCIKAKAANRDGVCIYEVAKRVRSFTKRPLLFMIVSDGSPSAINYREDEAIAHTRKIVEEVSANKFLIVQVGIEVEKETQASMFKLFINYENSKKMVEDLARKLRPLLHRLK